jgi:anti-sigma-K factor RskA
MKVGRSIMEQHSNGRQIEQYLLGQLPEDKQERLEEQLFTDDEYFERLRATEDALIDDYLLDRLSAHEREQFEQTFLTNLFLRKRVALAKALLDYIDSKAASAGAQDSPHLFFKRGRISQKSVTRRIKATVAPKLTPHGLRDYRVSLYVIAAVRVAILALIWSFIYQATFASSFHSPVISYVLTVLIVLYVPLEAVNLLRTVRSARLALAESQAEADPSSL